MQPPWACHRGLITVLLTFSLHFRHFSMPSSQSSSSGSFFSEWETQFPQFFPQMSGLPSLQDVLRLRQIHALEHGTVWVLSEQHLNQARRMRPRLPRTIAVDDEHLSGLSTHEGFYLYGQVETAQLTQAVRQALHRLTSGESSLAIHPRCGTNVAVGMTLTAGLVLGAHLLFPKNPLTQAIGLGSAVLTAAHLTPTIGEWAQAHLTTAIPFNLVVRRIYPLSDPGGRPTHFVQIGWTERS